MAYILMLAAILMLFLPIQILRRQTAAIYMTAMIKNLLQYMPIAIFSLKALLLIIIIFRPLFLKSA